MLKKRPELKQAEDCTTFAMRLEDYIDWLLVKVQRLENNDLTDPPWQPKRARMGMYEDEE